MIPTLRKKLTRIFNQYIRLRDSKNLCISCGKNRHTNAGHYISVGSQPKPSLAFNEKNVNGQCVFCNLTLGGNKHGSEKKGYEKGYTRGLIEKYGASVIDELKLIASLRQNPWKTWEYEEMIKLYKQKVKKIEKSENVG